MRPKGSGAAGASAALALLDDVPASPASRRLASAPAGPPERDLLYFYHGLLGLILSGPVSAVQSDRVGCEISPASFQRSLLTFLYAPKAQEKGNRSISDARIALKRKSGLCFGDRLRRLDGVIAAFGMNEIITAGLSEPIGQPHRDCVECATLAAGRRVVTQGVPCPQA